MKFIEIYILTLSILAADAVLDFSFANYNNEIIQESRLDMTEMVKKHGYEIETHKITTEDGYILTTYRMLPAQHCQNQTIRKPIILGHGIFSSSYDFVAEGPKKSLAYLLSNQCHDVWLKNSRGTTLSREHVTLKASDPKFWDFSWHEMGKYDIPAMIDYILNATNETNLHYIGHSQGTTEFFVFGSLRHEYHDKIVSMHALSPVIYLDYLENPVLKLGATFVQPLEILARILGIHDFYPIVKLANIIGPPLLTFPDAQPLITYLYYLFMGFDEPQFNITAGAIYLGHTPSDVATKQLYHFAQVVRSGKIKQYDYGIYKNLEVYGSMFPPEYNLSSINIPIVAYYSLKDNIVHIKDAKKTISALPRVVDVYEIPYSKFNHLDFIIATDAKILLYDKLLEFLRKYD